MSENRQIPYGRGGAGNMSNPRDAHVTDSAELITPTLKADIYTTGRGGSGNMVPNEDPGTARVRQDVGVPVPVNNSEDTYLTGRGGAANACRVTSREGPGIESKFSQEPDQTATGDKKKGTAEKDRVVFEKG